MIEWFVHLWAKGLSKGDEQPPKLLMGCVVLFTFAAISGGCLTDRLRPGVMWPDAHASDL